MATSVEELTNCAICIEVFTDPQVLPCDHVFCKSCVNPMKDAGTIKCPNCSKVCVLEDVKPDFRLVTFLDALSKTTERFTKLIPLSDDSDNVKRKHVTPPVGDKCESCQENVIDSFCHQCQQWFCKSCLKFHSRMKASRYHTYTTLTERSLQLKTSMSKCMSVLKKKSEKLKSHATFYETLVLELKATEESGLEKCEALRKVLHKDIDRYLNAAAKRIKTACNKDLATFANENQNMVNKANIFEELIARMDKLTAQADCELLAQGEQLLSKSKELSQSLEVQFIDAVEIPQVRLERRQDWSLEKAVDFELLPSQRNACVSSIPVKMLDAYTVRLHVSLFICVYMYM